MRRPGCPGSRSGPAPGKDTSLGSSGKPGIQQTDGPGIAATEPAAAVPGRRDAAGRMPCLERPRPCSAITLSGRQHHRNARSASLPLGMPRTRTIGRVGTIQNRLFCRVGTGWVSRRFYSPSLLPESPPADQHGRASRRDSGPPPSAMRPWASGSGAAESTDGHGRRGQERCADRAQTVRRSGAQTPQERCADRSTSPPIC